jgi:hypothetical protein
MTKYVCEEGCTRAYFLVRKEPFSYAVSAQGPLDRMYRMNRMKQEKKIIGTAEFGISDLEASVPRNKDFRCTAVVVPRAIILLIL